MYKMRKTPYNNPAALERSQVVVEFERLSASGERERSMAFSTHTKSQIDSDA
jgi:hypothetical protein